MRLEVKVVLFLVSCSLSAVYCQGYIRYIHTGRRGFPTMERAYLKSRGWEKPAVEEKVCSGPMSPCIPDVTQCCYNMKCLNRVSHYCLYPIEKCICTSVDVHNADTA